MLFERVDQASVVGLVADLLYIERAAQRDRVAVLVKLGLGFFKQGHAGFADRRGGPELERDRQIFVIRMVTHRLECDRHIILQPALEQIVGDRGARAISLAFNRGDRLIVAQRKNVDFCLPLVGSREDAVHPDIAEAATFGRLRREIFEQGATQLVGRAVDLAQSREELL